MDNAETNLASPASPRTTTVMGLIALVALIFSYLGAYAVANVLVSSDLIAPWPPDTDPRPAWMLRTFVSLIGIFLLLAGLFRFASHRQLQRIDQMSDADD